MHIINPIGERGQRWHTRETCLWEAPDWLSYPNVLCLAKIQDYRPLSSLFHDTLGIGNAGTDEFLQYIKYIKDDFDTNASQDTLAKIPTIYAALDHGTKETSLRIR